jgi:hypothetical protein
MRVFLILLWRSSMPAETAVLRVSEEKTEIAVICIDFAAARAACGPANKAAAWV